MLTIRQTLTITAANLQHVFTLPANTRRIRIRSLTGASFRISFAEGEVELFKGTLFSAEKTADTGYLHHSPTYVFVASPVPGNYLELQISTGPSTAIEQLQSVPSNF